jgi:hypothetical protein
MTIFLWLLIDSQSQIHVIMSAIDVAKLFICEIFCLHGLPKEIICDWD